jgi:NAD(P)-dependent dehydrogenase (short-subunit alcohol dehydrogenase family)
MEHHIPVERDVTDRDAIVAAAERVQRHLGGADILVNNAGVMLLAPSPPARGPRSAEWSRCTSSAR